MLAGMLATVLGSKCFGLRPGNAGDAKEELLVQQHKSAVFPAGRVALALQARRHTAQLDSLGGVLLEVSTYSIAAFRIRHGLNSRITLRTWISSCKQGNLRCTLLGHKCSELTLLSICCSASSRANCP